MAKKIIGFVFLAVAVAGLVYGIIGITTTKYTIKTETLDGVYDLTEKSFEGSAAINWSSRNGGISVNSDPLADAKKIAEEAHSRQIWIGFGAFAIGGLASLMLLRKSTGSLIHG